jgi:dihydroorotate dehydrogenase (fumarate)
MEAGLGKLKLEHPLMNAAGTCKTMEQCARFARSAVSAVVVGSITWEPREGNGGDGYFRGEGYSLNSLGLPNPGADYYRNKLPAMVSAAHSQQKPLGLSIAGFGPADYVKLTMLGASAEVDFIELNLSCPNVWHGGMQNELTCFVPSLVEAIVGECCSVAGGIPVGAKISPMSNPADLASFAQVVSLSGLSFVTAINTFPNAFSYSSPGVPAISQELAGLSGSALKPVALGQVKQLVPLLRKDVQVVGVGGVSCGEDIADLLAVGATAVQAATAYWNADEDPGVFSDLLTEFLALSPPEPVSA